MLPYTDTDLEQDASSFEYISCPSLCSSFYPSDEPTADSQGQRRPSLASSIQSASSEAFWTPSVSTTSPTTPMPIDSSAHFQYLKTDPYLAASNPLLHQLQNESHENTIWDVSTMSSHPLLDDTKNFLTSHTGDLVYHQDSQNNHGMSNPSLTKLMFNASADTNTCALPSADEEVPWSTVQPPAETIEPGIAFQNHLPSSPSYKIEPSTPLKGQCSSSIWSSSPMSTISPKVVPSQHDLYDLPYESLQQAFIDCKKQRAGPERLQKRSYERKRLGVLSKMKASRSKTGLLCDLIIPVNEFPCSFLGCVDKHNRPKAFKRQEHRKRHEATVHGGLKDYTCWVENCHKQFSRNDNLQSHLRNTHSKRPGVRGNRYVATLDKNSECYDPDWMGQLDEGGFPIFS